MKVVSRAWAKSKRGRGGETQSEGGRPVPWNIFQGANEEETSYLQGGWERFRGSFKSEERKRSEKIRPLREQESKTSGRRTITR